jgi:large subunit ribosomal protein LP0
MSRNIPEKKLSYATKFLNLVKEYERILLVNADNVGSKHFQQIRQNLRGRAVILMGKNTVVRKILRLHAEEHPQLQQLLPKLYGNLGFVFTNGDVNEIREVITSNRVGAMARVGAIAPCNVMLPAGPTGLEPGQTSFLQALDIPTMIVKGQIEIKNDIQVIKKGNKVNASQAALLVKLNIKPFEYGLVVEWVYDGGVLFAAEVLDLKDSDLLSLFNQGVRNIAAIGLAVGYPTLASVPHSVINGYKNVAAIALETSVSFKEIDELKNILADPEAFAKLLASKAAAAPAAGSGSAAAPAAKAEEPAPAEEEEEEDMGGGLFGDDEEDF